MVGRIGHRVGYVVASIAGWVGVFLAIAAAFVGFSYLRSGNPPYCPSVRPGDLAPPGALELGLVQLVALPVATLLVGLWWALGATSRHSRNRRLIALVPLAALVTVGGLTVLAIAPGPFGCLQGA